MNIEDVNILLVDDDNHTRLLAKTMLQTMGCAVKLEAMDGQEAVELYKQHQPDLVVLDINMPIMDGKQALTSIIQDFPEAIVIMWSSMDDENTIRECTELGATNFIRKHESVNIFTDLISAHIQEL